VTAYEPAELAAAADKVAEQYGLTDTVRELIAINDDPNATVADILNRLQR
jgi:hypothetical protein